MEQKKTNSPKVQNMRRKNEQLQSPEYAQKKTNSSKVQNMHRKKTNSSKVQNTQKKKRTAPKSSTRTETLTVPKST